MVNYCGKTLLFLGLKNRVNLLSYCSNLPSFQGKFSVINIDMVIYCHSIVITKVMLLYNTKSWLDHGMLINYHGKKFYNIGPRGQCYKTFFCLFLLFSFFFLAKICSPPSSFGMAYLPPSIPWLKYFREY